MTDVKLNIKILTPYLACQVCCGFIIRSFVTSSYKENIDLRREWPLFFFSADDSSEVEFSTFARLKMCIACVSFAEKLHKLQSKCEWQVCCC